MDRWTRVANELEAMVEDLDVARLDGRDALRVTRAAARIERLGANAKAYAARRCVDTGVWSHDREARVPAVTPVEWLADVSGSAVGPARDALAVTDLLHDGSPTDRALRTGELSLTAAREVTAAAEVGGECAERRVLQKATQEGLRSAKTEATRVFATAADADERERRIHRRRSLRQWTSREGEWNLHLAGPTSLGAEIQACLAPFQDAAWDAATRQTGEHRDGPDAIAFDGMLGMARAARDGISRPASSKPRGRAKTRDHVVVHVDATALAAGEVRDGERCEIPGVGPVPVDHARKVLGGGALGPAVLTMLVECGRDVRTLARPGRNVTADLARLLTARDATCVVRGCGRAARLEGDHGHPIADGGDSTAGNLRGMCRPHHRRKTDGWTLTEHPDGTRTLEPPAPTATDRRAKPAAA
ncbi:MAG TPA: HNH endonuclease signature motif containing protein [Acidimicrobiia bacterium]|nr:HNH endonuclease signature motif containing protein [Acidimicrobiia bacterium]